MDDKLSGATRLVGLTPPNALAPRLRPASLASMVGPELAGEYEMVLAASASHKEGLIDSIIDGAVAIIKDLVLEMLKAGWQALATFVSRWFEATSYEHTPAHVTMAKADRLWIWFGNVDDKATLHVNDEYVASASVGDPPPQGWFFTDEPLKKGSNWVVIALENSGGGAYGLGCSVLEYGTQKQLFIIDHSGFELATNKHLFKVKIYVES